MNSEERLASIKASREIPVNPALLEWTPRPYLVEADPGIAAFEAAKHAGHIALYKESDSDI